MLSYPFSQDDLIELWLSWYNGTVKNYHEVGMYKDMDYDKYTSTTKQKHYPVGKMIASKMQELLFNEPVKVKFLNEATQARFDQVRQKSNMDDVFAMACKMQSALGDTVLKINLDPMEDAPTISYYTPDLYEINEFKWGKVRDITFYTYQTSSKKKDYYVKEQHRLVRALNIDNVRTIQWEICQSLIEKDKMNGNIQEVSVETLEETAELTPVIYSDKKMFWHLPINKPNTLTVSEKGISDYHDSIDTFIEIDQALTSLFNDIIQGQAKMYVTADMLDVEYDDDGKPKYNYKINKNFHILMEELDDPIQVQFLIRFEEHLSGIEKLVMMAITQCKLSPTSFGYDSAGLKTATEVKSLQGASFSTKLNRQLSWKPALTELFEMFIEWDNVKNKTAYDSTVDSIEFQDSLENDVETTRKSVIEAVTGRIMSVWTGIKTLHPDWTDEAVIEEMQRINGIDDMEMME